MTNVVRARTRRPRSLRAAATSVLAVIISLFVFPAPEALAKEGEFIADKSAWFWSSNSRITVCTRERLSGQAQGACQRASGSDTQSTGPLPNPTALPEDVNETTPDEASTTPNPISGGHMAVSLKDGDPDMRSYVHVDTTTIPPGSSISRYVITLTVSSQTDATHTDEHSDAREKPPATVTPTTPSMRACAVSEFFADGTEGDPPYSTKITPGAPEDQDDKNDDTKVETFKNEPGVDLGACADGVPSSNAALWRFDITEIAKQWVALTRFDEGVAIIPMSRGLKETWTVEFHGAPRTKAVGDKEVDIVREADAAFAFVEYTPGAGGLGFLPPTGGGTGGVSLPPTPPVDTGQQPPATTPTDTGGQGGGGAVAVGVNLAKTPVWLFGVFLLGLIGLGAMASIIGGDPLTAGAGGGAARSRVAGVLRGRRLAGGEALEAAQAIEQLEETETSSE